MYRKVSTIPLWIFVLVLMAVAQATLLRAAERTAAFRRRITQPL